MKKVAIITGGAQGIGKGITLELNNKGIQTVIIDKDPDACNELSELLPEAFVLVRDVAVEKDVCNIVDLVIQQYGSLNYIINNASIGINRPIDELTFEEWHRVIDVNLSSIFLFAKYSKPWLIKSRGAIVNIASTRALMSEPDTEAYSASKGGVIALTHALAISLGPHVRVNSISPGWIEVSDFQKRAKAKEPYHTEADRLQHPVGRVGRPDDIASMVYFLLHQEDSFITGQNFIVDGGMTKRMIYV